MTSLTHFKYDISAMMHIVKDTNDKVQALISKSNENNSTVSLSNTNLDMSIFPLTSEDQLIDMEKKIEDTDFKNALVLFLNFLYIHVY